MRCYICDYSADVESIYFNSLTDSHKHNNFITKMGKRSSQEYICGPCRKIILDTRKDFFYRDNYDKLDDWNTIIPKGEQHD